jgi:hypothetical protein
MTSVTPLRMLLLCDYRRDIAATVREHIDAMVGFSTHHVRRVSTLEDLPPRLNLAHFDAVILHYSLVACIREHASARLLRALAKYRGLKAIFVQDEYRLVDATIAIMQEIGVDILFTCVPKKEIEKVYPAQRLPGVTKINVLTGYVPEHLLSRAVRPYKERPIDVGYRARKVPAWLGELGREKYEIGKIFREDSANDGLALDISFREEDRLYGERWIEFVCKCKAMLGVESGASVFDFTGEIQRNVEAHERRNPGVDFETLKRLYFAEADGKIALNQISPRCFEAAALRTLLVIYEGDYSGRMQAWRHYVPLKKDHSNHAEVVAVIKDPVRATEIIETAYREVASNPDNTFRAFVAQFDEVISATFRPEQHAILPYLSDREFEMLATPGWSVRRRWATRRIIETSYRFLFSIVLGRARPETRDVVQAWLKSLLHPLRAIWAQLKS